MLPHILWFAFGLVLLIKGGDWFVDGAADLARRFRVPDILIGATVVSIGTTLPEVMVSATSAAQGQGAMAYGNAVGSVICNTALISALTVAIRPSSVDRKSLLTPVAFFFGAAAIYSAVAYTGGNFTRPVGLVLLALFVIYMVVAVRQALTSGSKASEEAGAEEDGELMPVWKELLLLVLGAGIIAWGADLLVDHGIAIAEGFGVPQTVIALTFVALGTSLPELVTAITSLIKGHSALSLGNICGANLFNLVLVSGMAITIGPVRFSAPTFGTMMLGGKEVFSSLVIDTPLMLIVMAVLTLPAIKTGQLKRWQGILLLCLYAGFCAFQFMG